VEQLEAVRLLEKAFEVGLKNSVTESELDYIKIIVEEYDESGESLGANNQEDIANNLLNSTGFSALGNIHWGWKEPNSHIFLPAILLRYPNLKYIHMVRNGLDMAYSNNQQQRLNWKNCLHIFKPYEITSAQDQIDTANDACIDSEEAEQARLSLSYWISANLRVLDIGHSMPQNNFMLIKYEQLCENPVEESMRIAHFLEIDHQAGNLPDLVSNIKASSTIGRYKNFVPLNLSSAWIEAIAKIGYDK